MGFVPLDPDTDDNGTLDDDELSEPFFDDFEKGTLGHSWVVNNLADVLETAANTESYGARFRNTSSMELRISTIGHSAVNITYDRRGKNLETGEMLTIDCSVDGFTWCVLETVTDGDWASQTFDLTANATEQAGFRLRFSLNGDLNTDQAYIDNVSVTFD
ncbi:hypothetical protein [Thalassotalea crassostreae]|uniref:hypothetical protein n=1 Tax=Thalassotalea crassostreae TaxID=1763536 RepID=UPI000838C53F|nr:hypothetical protein [Thalassotalea crassostreae]